MPIHLWKPDSLTGPCTQAKNINLIGVKVLNILGSGFTSDIIKGVEWSVDDATSNGRISTSVISMSLGGGYSAAMNSAVAAAIRSGIFVAVAAGNDNKDAAEYSPASEPTVSLRIPGLFFQGGSTP